MQKAEHWLEEKLNAHKENPYQTIIEMLLTTNRAIEQFIENPNSKLAKEILESCLAYNNIFLRQSIGDVANLKNKSSKHK